MKKQIEVFFDYVCPFCNKGIRQFLDILPDYLDTEVIWRPCEAHPRPEHANIHSDLAIQAMYYLRDQGGDLIRFHTEVYDAWFCRKQRIDDIELLASLAEKCGGDKEGALAVLRENRYAGEVVEGNRYAWEEKGLYAVPSYCCGDKTAYSKNGLLVSIKKVRTLLEK